MRGVVVAAAVGLLSALAPAPRAHAADGTLATGGSHEVTWTPPSLLPIRGPRFAPVTIDVYVTLGSPPSYLSAELARRWVERDPSVRAVLHAYGYGTYAEQAMEALLEAADQGRFYPLFDKLAASRLSLTAPVDWGRLGRDAGLDGERLDEALASHRHRSDAERLQREGRGARHHPPEILLNGRRMSPYAGDEAFGKGIADAHARAEELLADGVPLSQLYDRLLELDEELPFGEDPLARGGRRRMAVDLTAAPVRGPATAPVTIVLWANFACMQCVESAATIARVVATHPGLVRVAWKHMPSPYREQLGQNAAEFAAAAHAQGRFWPLYDLSMASHLVPARVSRSELDRLGAQVGLDDARLHAEIDSGRARAAVERDAAEARRLGIPTAGFILVDGLPVQRLGDVEGVVAMELDAGVLERLKRH